MFEPGSNKARRGSRDEGVRKRRQAAAEAADVDAAEQAVEREQEVKMKEEEEGTA